MSPLTTERNDSGLLSVERAPFEANERAADHRAIVEANERAAEHRAIVEDRRTSSGTPRHRRRPTIKQWITAPPLTRKERLRTPVRRARTIRSQRASGGSPRHRRGRRASSGTPRHRRRPTNEQRNTAPSSKADEQAADHRAIVDSKGTTPDSDPSSVSNQKSQLQFLTSRQCTIKTATTSHASQSTSTTIARI